MSMTATPSPTRDPPASASSEAGREGFMKLNMELDYVNRSPTGRQCEVVGRSFGRVGSAASRDAVELHPRTTTPRRRPRPHFGRHQRRGTVSGGRRAGQRSLRRLRGRHPGKPQRERAPFPRRQQRWTICMERAPLEPLLAGIPEPLQRCIQGDNPALRLLDGYLETLFSLDQECDPRSPHAHPRSRALRARRGGRHPGADARTRRSCGACRGRARDDPRARRRTGLDPARFAERMGMSVRYLHRLLEPTGRSFAEHLLEQRLERAPACCATRPR